jgi:hypothetical protein
MATASLEVRSPAQSVPLASLRHQSTAQALAPHERPVSIPSLVGKEEVETVNSTRPSTLKMIGKVDSESIERGRIITVRRLHMMKVSRDQAPKAA